MAKSGRPASESYQPACRSVTPSLISSRVRLMVDDDAPIFSLSKSSVDVVMPTSPLHKWDPAWARRDLKRSSSTNTHSTQNSASPLQQLQHRKWRPNPLSFTTQNEDLLSPPPLSERWMSNTNRWSECSGGAQSRSSTPDTVVWRGDPERSPPPRSPSSKTDSPFSALSPLVSPFYTPTLPTTNHFSCSSSSPLKRSTEQLGSPDLHPASAESNDSAERLVFQFPSPIPSPVSLANSVPSPDPACFNEDPLKSWETNNPAEDGAVKSPPKRLSDSSLSFQTTGEESIKELCVGLLQQQEQKPNPTSRGWKSPLVSSFSDSQLCRPIRSDFSPCSRTPPAIGARSLAEASAMTSRLEMVDVAVQTVSPLGSWRDLRESVSPSNTESHSILGSPPGSRLNLKSPVGSHSNLVSPSSSMFPGSSNDEEEEEEEEEKEEKPRGKPEWGAPSTSPNPSEKKRTCLKIHGVETDELGRRSSMKQVQWDEDGLTWDIHGASVDPEELSSAIQKHLQRKSSPQVAKRSSKKKKAPKPPVISNLVTTMAPDMSPPAMTIKCMVEGESQDTIETIGAPEGRPSAEKEKAEEVPRRRSRLLVRDDSKDKEETGSGEGDVKDSPVRGNEHGKKKTRVRSLRRPLWCGSSKNTDD